MKDENVQLIPIDQIRILNPRFRDKKKFETVVESIRELGLKKPIKVSLRSPKEGDESGYDLVCGQGRIEAFRSLGHHEIPAIIVEIDKADRLLMSLVENMARRFSNHSDLIREIERLKTRGYTNVAIGKKLGLNDAFVGGLLALHNEGEERLLDAALKNKIPLGVAIEIARTEGIDAQRELLKAYENKQLNGASIRTVKRLIEHRRFLGKDFKSNTSSPKKKIRTNAEALVNAYRKESQRQKLLLKKAKICEAKLLFLVTALKKLLTDDNFINLLRAENLSTIPKYLAQQVKLKPGVA